VLEMERFRVTDRRSLLGKVRDEPAFARRECAASRGIAQFSAELPSFPRNFTGSRFIGATPAGRKLTDRKLAEFLKFRQKPHTHFRADTRNGGAEVERHHHLGDHLAIRMHLCSSDENSDHVLLFI